MVKILASGEVVADDDSRTKANQKASNSGRRRETRGIANVRQDEDVGLYGQEQAEGGARQQGAGQSIINTLNQTLIGYGFPRFALGPTHIEPIAILALVILLIFFGLPGLLIFLMIFTFVKLSEGHSLKDMASWFGFGGAGNGPAAMGGGGEGRALGRN